MSCKRLKNSRTLTAQLFDISVNPSFTARWGILAPKSRAIATLI